MPMDAWKLWKLVRFNGVFLSGLSFILHRKKCSWDRRPLNNSSKPQVPAVHCSDSRGKLATVSASKLDEVTKCNTKCPSEFEGKHLQYLHPAVKVFSQHFSPPCQRICWANHGHCTPLGIVWSWLCKVTTLAALVFQVWGWKVSLLCHKVYQKRVHWNMCVAHTRIEISTCGRALAIKALGWKHEWQLTMANIGEWWLILDNHDDSILLQAFFMLSHG